MEHSYFPLDIYHEIIDLVASDPSGNRATLTACALTARSWLPRARFGLYRKVVLHGDKQCVAFSKALLACSALGPLVRELMLHTYVDSAWCLRDNNPLAGLYDPFPLQAVRTMSNLRSMAYEYNGGELVSGVVPFLREVASHPSLRTLGLGSFTFSSCDDLEEILAAGPHLTSVFIAACLFNNWHEFKAEDSGTAPDYCRDLRTVVLTDNERMDPLLLTLPSPSNITRLTLGPTWRETDPDFRKYYENVTLNYFQDLSGFVRLERLVLLVVDTSAWVVDALAMIRSTELQVLSIFCWYEERHSGWGSALRDLLLGDIDMILSKAPFLGLQRVSLVVYCRDRTDEETEDSASDSSEDQGSDTDVSTDNLPGCGEREDVADGPVQDSLWFEQQVREAMTNCREREILEVQAKVGRWRPVPYSIDPRLSEYGTEMLHALHLDPSI